jgi:hypothetical protein
MKKLKKLGYVGIVYILFISCNSDTELEIIEEANEPQINQSTQLKTTASCDLELVVTYTFSPFSTEEEQDEIRAQFRAEMSQYFTICEITLGDRSCSNLEKWSVNEEEYYIFKSSGIQPGGTSNSSNGSATISIVKPGGGSAGGTIFDCF